MGNGVAKGVPPTGVVTIVLAGGRVEIFKKPIVAGDIMLRHPRHHVVRPDFFRSSPVQVLRPEEILMPGHKFFLVPFHTVHKKLSGKVEVLHQPSTSSSARLSTAPATGPAHPTASVQPGAIKDLHRLRHVSVGTQQSVETGKADSTGVATARRSPISLHGRKTLRHKQMLRNSRKRRSGDNDDFARMRISPLSRTKRNSNANLATKLRETESIESSDLTELQSFRTADFAKCEVSIESLTSTKRALSSDLTFPEYESFQTSVSASRGLRLERPLSAVTYHNLFDAVDFSEAEKASIAPLLPTTAALVKKLVRSYEARALYTSQKDSRQQVSPKIVRSVEATDDSKPEKTSRKPPLQMRIPSSQVSVRDIEERIDSRGADSRLNHHTRLKEKQDLKFNKSLTPVRSSAEAELRQQKLQGSVKKIVQSFEKKIVAQQIMPDTVTSVKHEGTGSSKPCESPTSEPPLRMQTRAPVDGYPSGLGKKEMANFRGGDSCLHHQTQIQDVDLQSKANHPPRPACVKEAQLTGQLTGQKFTIKMAADSQQAISHGDRQNLSREQATASRETTVRGHEQPRSSSGRSEQRSPRQQQKIMEGQAGGVKALQQVHRRAEKSIPVVKALSSGPTFEPSPVASNPLMTRSPGKKSTAALIKQRKPNSRRLMEHLCLSSSQVLRSPRHVHAGAGGSRERQIKSDLKLIDHLKLEPSHPTSHLQKLYQKSPLHAHATKVNNPALRRRLHSPRARPTSRTGSGSISESPRTQKDNGVSLQLNKIIKIQVCPSKHPQNDVKNMDVTPIEEKFLKISPVGLLRSGRIRTRRRVHTIKNWKPKLSPLVEFSP